MKRKNVESSMIESIGYDVKKKVLEVEFKNGRVYKFNNIEKKVYDELVEAESKGKYFNEKIKNLYSYELVSELE